MCLYMSFVIKFMCVCVCKKSVYVCVRLPLLASGGSSWCGMDFWMLLETWVSVWAVRIKVSGEASEARAQVLWEQKKNKRERERRGYSNLCLRRLISHVTQTDKMFYHVTCACNVCVCVCEWYLSFFRSFLFPTSFLFSVYFNYLSFCFFFSPVQFS